MNAYHELAGCYDRLTNDVDYAAVVDFYNQILAREGLCPRTALDLACGTGSVALLLAQEGLSVTAIDMSPEMLCIASQKAQEQDLPIQFVCQQLQALNVPRGVDLAVCALDSLNYILDPEDCQEAIHRIYRSLNPGGCFIFDVNTPQKLQAMDGQVFLDEDDDVYCVWRGEFDQDTHICSYGMDLFHRKGNVWQRSFEEHQEYAYTEEQLRHYLKSAGFTHIRVYSDRSFQQPDDSTQRIYFKARKGIIKCVTI